MKEISMVRKIIVLLVICAFFAGCTMGYRNVGTPDKWQQIKASLKIGVTTEANLLELLGPPSLMDVRHMKKQKVYYYWVERLKNKSIYLLVYNYWRVDIKYDRAMFVFDENGLLKYYGISMNATKGKKK